MEEQALILPNIQPHKEVRLDMIEHLVSIKDTVRIEVLYLSDNANVDGDNKSIDMPVSLNFMFTPMSSNYQYNIKMNVNVITKLENSDVVAMSINHLSLNSLIDLTTFKEKSSLSDLSIVDFHEVDKVMKKLVSVDTSDVFIELVKQAIDVYMEKEKSIQGVLFSE